jgi:hypothetical protein
VLSVEGMGRRELGDIKMSLLAAGWQARRYPGS